MIKTRNPRPTEVPAISGREVSVTDGSIVCAQKQKELSLVQKTMQYEDETIVYIIHDGKKLYPVHYVGELYGYNNHDALQAFNANKKFLEGYHYRLKLRLYQRAVSVPCLTGEGVLIYTARLGIGSIPEDRQNLVIRTVQFMAQSAMDVIQRNQVPHYVRPVLWNKERVETKSNEKLCMEYVKKYEVPKQVWRNPRDPYQRENREVNVDTIGVHIHGLSDKLNENGLQIKNEAYVIDMALMEAGVDFEPRHQIVKNTLNITHQHRCPENLLLTVTEQERLKKQLPASQTGISDFMAVV
jgi:hypothetical protein